MVHPWVVALALHESCFLGRTLDSLTHLFCDIIFLSPFSEGTSRAGAKHLDFLCSFNQDVLNLRIAAQLTIE